MRLVTALLSILVSATLSLSADTQPFAKKPNAIPGLIEAEHYDLGAAEIAYHDVDPQNRGAKYREETQVDIEKRDDASGGHGIGWTKKGEWLIYTVKVAKTAKYDVSFPVASNKRGGIFHLEAEGKDLSGPIKIPDTGGWDKLEVIHSKGIKLTKGTFQLKVVMDEEGPSGSIGDIDYMNFTIAK